ncbi:MAG: gliding motility-associated C-terminal domain-containing protein [Bacteroidota bacterium]
MSDLNNIDKLLKDNFVDFTPDAPDVWQGIEQGVQAAQAGQAAATAAAVKGTSLVVKIIAAVAISASVVTGYVLLTGNEPEAKQEATVNTTITEPVTAPMAVSETTAGTNVARKTTTEATAESKTGISAPLTQPATEGTDKQVKHLAEPIQQQLQPEVTQLKEQPKTDLKTVEKTPVTNTPPVANKENGPVKESQETTPQKTETQPSNPVENEYAKYDEANIPNVFSPNGDGINDKFVIPIENEQLYSLTITDKNGKEVFESMDKNIQWDGRDYKSGIMCPAGIYYRVFRYQLKGAPSENKTFGTITIIN